MSKIDELIAELCPNGVEYRELGELLNYEQPSRYIVRTTEYNESFDIPVLTAGRSFILGYTDEKEGIYPASKERPVIIFDDFTTSSHWVDFQFKVKSSAIKMLTPKSCDVDFRYVYFAIMCTSYKPSDHARHWISKYSKIKIPIPPIEVQKEVVKILDKFTQLEAELEAELEARRVQYEHYRNQLLTFDELRGAIWVPLSEVIKSLKTGLNPRKNFMLNTNDATNYYVTVRELNGVGVNFLDKTDRVNDEALKMINNRSNLEVGDVLFSGTGTIGRTALVDKTPNNWNIKEGVYVIKPKQDTISSKFLLYYLNSSFAKLDYSARIVGSSVNSVPMSELKKIKIPIPPREEQDRIVTILDKFDTLVNDISAGLPAEIAARRQQYEYYRTKLLTFKELDA